MFFFPLLFGISCTGSGDYPKSKPVSLNPLPDQQEDADIFTETLGTAVPWLSEDFQHQYDDGAQVMEKAFFASTGLGPTFNADSCSSCHQAPVAGGSAPRYRDLWLVKKQRWDGALENAGSNGISPVRNQYATAPLFHVPEAEGTTLYARRNAPPTFGVGLFAFVTDEAIMANADPDDEDGNGISGRANYEQGLIGRFGYKSQAASMESFNRGAMINQMGITTDPLFFRLPESPEELASNTSILDILIPSAHAQVSAPDEPTTDDDGVPDPEMSNADQQALLIFSTYIAAPKPKDMDEDATNGAQQFTTMGCADCHTPRLQSTIGPIRAYTDLLLHDMGPDLADGISVGFASGQEFRTQPLWGVILHAPYLHDGRANTLTEAIEWHGGEAASSRDRWLASSAKEQHELLAFLESLGGENPEGGSFIPPSKQPPSYGELGGPSSSLEGDEADLFEDGWRLFDQNFTVEDGLNRQFNADSCRSCHQDPVIGGAGGADVNVLLMGHRDATDTFQAFEQGTLHRSSRWDVLPASLPAEANIIEFRNPPSILGAGLVDQISTETILAQADPDDANNDGISGRARILSDGRLGRFGWKGQIPSLNDFVADALINEIGLTMDESISDFTIQEDDDECPDPEVETQDFAALSFFLYQLAPPTGATTGTETGASLFQEVGCAACHTPSLDNVPLYSDLLIHDIAEDATLLLDTEEGLLPTEYRTPPLWGISTTAPYLHDGSAATLSAAITEGHFGEASQSRQNFIDLSAEQKQELISFLQSL